MILLLACMPSGPDPALACAVFDAATVDLVSPEADADLEQGLVELAKTASRSDLPADVRSELRSRYVQLATFAQQRSSRRTARVKRLVDATLTAFPDHGIQVASESVPLSSTTSLPAEAQALVQQLAHERGRQRRLLVTVEELCASSAAD